MARGTSKGSVAIWVALIGAAGVVFGNMVTAFGPSIFSWGNRASYTDTEAYKEIVKDYPRLDDTLGTLLTKTESIYKSRDLTVYFAGISADQMSIVLTNKTVVQNVLERTITYRHSISSMEDTQVQSLVITYQNGQETKYGRQELDNMRRTSPGGLAYTSLKFEIPSNETITVETEYRMKKPKTFMEPCVVNKLLLGSLNMTIKKATNLRNIKTDVQSLSFDELITTTLDSNKNQVVKVAGPIFPGQGIALSWRL